MFTDAEKDQMEAMLGYTFDAFKEKIVIYKTPTTAFVTSSATEYNFAFQGEQPALDAEYVTNSGEFWATIEYVDQQDQQKLTHVLNNTPVQQPFGDVRISTTGSVAYEFLQDCEKIVLDGKDFRRITDVMPRGLFRRTGYDCWLKKIDNG